MVKSRGETGKYRGETEKGKFKDSKRSSDSKGTY